MKYCPICGEEYKGRNVCPSDGSVLIAFQEDELLGAVLKETYRIEERIGQGAMGAVYRAVQLPLERDVAVKVILNSRQVDKETAKRFFREAQLLSQLHHPNIVSVHDFGNTVSGTLYMVLEYLEGTSLYEYVPVGGLPLEHVVSLMEPICSGVGAAHRQNLVHRDLKPSNIVLAKTSGGTSTVKILDFGLAKLVASDKADTSHLTRDGMLMGTPGFISPEQIRETSSADERSDMYALGAILAFLVTGQPPYEGQSAQAVIMAQLERAPHVLDALSPQLAPLVSKAMARTPDKRYPSPEVLLHALHASTGIRPQPLVLDSQPKPRGVSTRIARPVGRDSTKLPPKGGSNDKLAKPKAPKPEARQRMSTQDTVKWSSFQLFRAGHRRWTGAAVLTGVALLIGLGWWLGNHGGRSGSGGSATQSPEELDRAVAVRQLEGTAQALHRELLGWRQELVGRTERARRRAAEIASQLGAIRDAVVRRQLSDELRRRREEAVMLERLAERARGELEPQDLARLAGQLKGAETLLAGGDLDRARRSYMGARKDLQKRLDALGALELEVRLAAARGAAEAAARTWEQLAVKGPHPGLAVAKAQQAEAARLEQQGERAKATVAYLGARDKFEALRSDVVRRREARGLADAAREAAIKATRAREAFFGTPSTAAPTERTIEEAMAAFRAGEQALAALRHEEARTQFARTTTLETAMLEAGRKAQQARMTGADRAGKLARAKHAALRTLVARHQLDPPVALEMITDRLAEASRLRQAGEGHKARQAYLAVALELENIGGLLHRRIDALQTAWRGARGAANAVRSRCQKASQQHQLDAEVPLVAFLQALAAADAEAEAGRFAAASKAAPTAAAALRTAVASLLVSGATAQPDGARRLALLAEAIQLDPTHAPAYLQRGRVQRDQGRNPLAIADFRSAIKYDPRLWVAHRELAQALGREGSRWEARQVLQDALNAAPAPERPRLEAALRELAGR